MNQKQILLEFTKGEFMNFLQNDSKGKILEIINDEGMVILEKSDRKKERISYILSFSKYVDELFQNPKFLDMFLNSEIDDSSTLNHLKKETYDLLLKRSIELQKDSNYISRLFKKFNTEYKINVLNNWPYSIELLYKILETDEAIVVQKIMDTYNIGLTNYKVDIENFFERAKRFVLEAKSKRNLYDKKNVEINIPAYMINESLAAKIWQTYDIFTIRKIIENARFSTDVSLLNDFVKEKEEKVIKNWDIFTTPYPVKKISALYFKAQLEKEKATQNDIYEDFVKAKDNLRRFIRENNYNKLYEKLEKQDVKDLNEIEKYILKLNGQILSNYIIDYLFEENYYNVMIDIQELLNFYYRGNIVLPEERVEMYNQILHIDELSVDEKKTLFNEMYKINIIEIFYDDMAYARDIIAESIKEYSLSAETIQEYKDEVLSKKYGVDVFNMNGEPFFGIVKTGTHKRDVLPTAHSYSLIGHEGIAVYGNPKLSDTFLYDADTFNPDQLVHVFPYDSYTFYHPFEYSETSTKYINNLLTADELVKVSEAYNEILLLEKGDKEVGIEEKIPELKKIALFCIDEIRKQDIEIAKKNNVGIFFVSTKKYVMANKRKVNFSNNINATYFDKYSAEKFEAKR